MFTGIVKQVFQVLKIIENHKNKTFEILADPFFIQEIQIDESIAHDGVCLTVESKNLQQNTYTVTAIYETLIKTSLQHWSVGKRVNIERSLKLNDLMGGHFVQGHVDTTAVLKNIENQEGSYQLFFEYPSEFHRYIVPKGSICVNGVSLTVVLDKPGLFSVCVIPFTWEHTNFKHLKINDLVNIEFDIIGKYLAKWNNQ
jgi:riboflavin synthase